MNSIARLLAMLIVMSVSVVANAQEYVYWANKSDKKIQRNNVVGSPTQDVLTVGLDAPVGVDIHNGIGKVYWTDEGTKQLSRSNLDGAKAEVLWTSSSALGAVAVAESISKVYWVETGSGLILRANLDGSSAEKLITQTSNVSSIAVDENSGKLYWADLGDNAVRRSNLDGTDVEDIITTGLSAPSGVAVHAGYGKIYIADEGNRVVMRADLDGQNLEIIVKDGTEVRSMVIDEVADRIYWIGAAGNELRRAFCNGQGVETVVSGLGESTDLALIPETSLAIDRPRDVGTTFVTGLELSQPYPNPVHGTAHFSVASDRDTQLVVSIVDVLGRTVANVYNGPMDRGGRRDFLWNTAAHPDGIYFVSIRSETKVASRKLSVRR